MPTYQSYPPSLWAPAAASTVSSLNPATGAVGATPALTVTGTGFTSGSKVSFDGDERATVVVSDTQLTCSIAAIVGPARTVQVTVSTGGSSPFTITATELEESSMSTPTEPEPTPEPVEPQEPPTEPQEPA